MLELIVWLFKALVITFCIIVIAATIIELKKR